MSSVVSANEPPLVQTMHHFNFHIFLYNYFIKLEECPKGYFPSYLETKISVTEVHILSLFHASFKCFFTGIWRECCPLIRQEKLVGEFLLFASFKSYDYFSEEHACFIKTQSLTVCQKQTRQVIKIV